MQFRTAINIEPLGVSIGYNEPGMLVGSCFAQNMAEKMKRLKFPVYDNPFGILFNPASISNMFDRLDNERFFEKEELVRSGDLWVSMEHHGKFSALDEDDVLRNINESVTYGVQWLNGSKYVVITFGTAWVYEYKQRGIIVGNCHKLPSDMFSRRRLSVDEIEDMFDKHLQGCLKDKKVIFTVSPVRHIKDGFEENQLSKSTLIVAVHNIVDRYSDCFYFPSYEIMNDDLRDYRFYDADMVHPSQVAVNYIWELFMESVMDPSTIELSQRVERVVTASEHRPLNPESDSYRRFCEKTFNQIRQIVSEHPEIDLNKEIEYFTK